MRVLTLHVSLCCDMLRVRHKQDLDNCVRSFLNDANERIDELKELIKAQSHGQPVDQQAHLKVALSPCSTFVPTLLPASSTFSKPLSQSPEIKLCALLKS